MEAPAAMAQVSQAGSRSASGAAHHQGGGPGG